MKHTKFSKQNEDVMKQINSSDQKELLEIKNIEQLKLKELDDKVKEIFQKNPKRQRRLKSRREV